MAFVYRQLQITKLLNNPTHTLDNSLTEQIFDIPLPDCKIVTLSAQITQISAFSGGAAGDVSPFFRVTLAQPGTKVTRDALPGVFPLPGDKGYIDHVHVDPFVWYQSSIDEIRAQWPGEREKAYTLARAPKIASGIVRVFFSGSSYLWSSPDEAYATLKLLIREEAITDEEKAVISWGGTGKI
jgi:hypothetical protein